MKFSAGRLSTGGLRPPVLFGFSATRLRQAAFTLIELVVSIVVLATVAAIALSRIDTDGFAVSTEAAKLADDIRYVQTLGMTQAQRHVMQLTAPRSYVITDDTGIAVKQPSGGVAGSQALAPAISFGALSGLTSSYIGFDGRGIPYTASPLTALTSNASIPIVAGNSSRTVVIEAQTGRVTVQ